MRINGTERCAWHGGRVGTQDPNFKNGRYSKVMPARLFDRFQESRDDPDLLNLRSEIALADTRLQELLSRVDSGESGWIWDRLHNTHRALESANRRGDDKLVKTLMAELGETISDGHADYATWNEIIGLVDVRRRLVESERKRLVDMKMILTVEQGMVLVSRLFDAVGRHVSDPELLARISAELGEIANQPTPKPLVGQG